MVDGIRPNRATGAPLDGNVVEKLTMSYLNQAKSHLVSGFPSQVKVLEILNALATVTALLLHGTGPDPAAIGFFQEALENQLDELKKEADASAHTVS